MSFKVCQWLCFVAFTLTAVIAAIPKEYEDIRQQHNYGDFISDIINSTLNNMLKNVSDPLLVKEMSKDFKNNSLISGGFKITKLRIDGLKGIVATKIHYNLFSTILNVTIRVPDINVNFAYWVDVVFGELIPFYGSGRNNIALEETEILVNGCAMVVSDGLHFHDTRVILNLGEITFDLNGLLNNTELSALLNSILNDNLVNLVDDNQELITNLISPIVEIILNDVFENKPNRFANSYYRKEMEIY